MRILKDERGQMLVMAALSMALLMACVAIAVDVGTLFNARRKVQIAADAAAVAGALELDYNGSTNVTTNADNAATANGITNTNQVTVNQSPGDGYHQGGAFVEVVIRQPNPTTFMGMFIPGKVNVAARAVAGVVANTGCVTLLNKTAVGAVSAKGAFTINSAGCGWLVNSDSQQAVCITGAGNNGKFTVPWVRFHAPSIKTAKNCNGSLSSPVVTGASTVSDPLGGLISPTTCDHTLAITTMTAGDANAQLTGTVCFTNTVTISGTGNLSGKMYVFNGGVEIATGANITVPDGTFDIAENPGTLNEKGGQSCVGNKTNVGFVQDSSSSLTIDAPTDNSTYHGIAIMEPSGDTNPLEVQFGSNSGTYGSGILDGLIYAPSAPVYLHDNGGGTTATGLIADTLDVCSSTLTITSFNSNPSNNSPLNTVALVE